MVDGLGVAGDDIASVPAAGVVRRPARPSEAGAGVRALLVQYGVVCTGREMGPSTLVDTGLRDGGVLIARDGAIGVVAPGLAPDMDIDAR